MKEEQAGKNNLSGKQLFETDHNLDPWYPVLGRGWKNVEVDESLFREMDESEPEDDEDRDSDFTHQGLSPCQRRGCHSICASAEGVLVFLFFLRKNNFQGNIFLITFSIDLNKLTLSKNKAMRFSNMRFKLWKRTNWLYFFSFQMLPKLRVLLPLSSSLES